VQRCPLQVQPRRLRGLLHPRHQLCCRHLHLGHLHLRRRRRRQLIIAN
jgi:hypothetical protein